MLCVFSLCVCWVYMFVLVECVSVCVRCVYVLVVVDCVCVC